MARCERQKGYGNTAKKFLNLKILCLLTEEEILKHTHIHTHTHTHIYIYTYTIAHGMWTTQQHSSKIGDRGFQEPPRTVKKEEAKSACTLITLQSNTFSLYWSLGRPSLDGADDGCQGFPVCLLCVSFRPPSDPYQLATSACHWRRSDVLFTTNGRESRMARMQKNTGKWAGTAWGRYGGGRSVLLQLAQLNFLQFRVQDCITQITVLWDQHFG